MGEAVVYEVPAQPSERSLQQLMEVGRRPAAVSPLAQGRPRRLRTLFGAAAVAVAFSGVALIASVWTVEPAPAAKLLASSGPSLRGEPPSASSPGRMSLAPSHRSPSAEAAVGTPKEIDGLSGVELRSAFDALFKQAQAGDRALAHALGQRLHECNSRQRLKQQEVASIVQMQGMPDWAQLLDQSWRERCIGLSVHQLDQAEALQALAAKQGHPRAMFEQAARTLATLDLAEYEASNAGQTATRTPAQNESALASVRTLEALAQGGDLDAIRTLGGVYARGSLVPADEVKFFVYRLLAQHDWKQPAASMGDSPLIAGLDSEVRTKVLLQAVALFDSCCAHQAKPR